MNRALTASFDEVAEHYDRQPNPMLALEKRFLFGLLPDLKALDVLDLGCGTGRWLRYFSTSNAGSVIGVDPSGRMLAIARRGLPNRVALLQGTAGDLPIPDRSVDVVVLSFALSYSSRVDSVVQELARVARPGAHIFLSDVHPSTQQRLNWKRTFQGDAGSVEMDSEIHELGTITSSFRRSGFRLASLLELGFGPEEEPLFTKAGKSAYFSALNGIPAIYLAQFVAAPFPEPASLSLSGGRIAFRGNAAAQVQLQVSHDTITAISASAGSDASQEIDLSGCLVLPGLINAHDHLEFGLYPNLGRGPYKNCRQWAEDIHEHYGDVIAAHSRIPKDVRLYWGALRNLLSGVTSVCHHNPGAPVFQDSDFPVRVVDEIAWSHSLSFDPQTAEKFACSEQELPFVVHVAEGIDQLTSGEISELDRIGALSDRTVVVHGLNCSLSDVALLNARQASLVACPSSNQFLFSRTIAPDFFGRIQRSALGTDSPLTAAGDYLDEIRVAKRDLRVSHSKLYEMCTSKPASILRLRHGEGHIRVGARADLLVVRDTGDSPASRLVDLQLEDIELILIGGRVHLASPRGMRRLSRAQQDGLHPLRVGDILRWVRAPLPMLLTAAQAVLGDELYLGNKRVTYAG